MLKIVIVVLLFSNALISQQHYADDEVAVTIPTGWSRVARRNASMGNSVSPGAGTLLLMKNGYVLGLAYKTGHASGITGGRFIEALRIPWLDTEGSWDCSLYFSSSPLPVSRRLLFNSLVFRAGDKRGRQHCGVPLVGETRWFAGYFTTATGGWFFDEEGEPCGAKAFTLTSSATEPGELPVPGDAVLQQTIQEAIDIVNSIHWRRCAPK